VGYFSQEVSSRPDTKWNYRTSRHFLHMPAPRMQVQLYSPMPAMPLADPQLVIGLICGKSLRLD
jgi:hypothetical protein